MDSVIGQALEEYITGNPDAVVYDNPSEIGYVMTKLLGNRNVGAWENILGPEGVNALVDANGGKGLDTIVGMANNDPGSIWFSRRVFDNMMPTVVQPK